VSAGEFVAAVEEFRRIAENPGLPLPLKARAWGGVVLYATRLDPNETGFERAGVALKQALSLWLDIRSAQPHCDSRLAA